jgi:hypothetical protein
MAVSVTINILTQRNKEDAKSTENQIEIKKGLAQSVIGSGMKDGIRRIIKPQRTLCILSFSVLNNQLTLI